MTEGEWDPAAATTSVRGTTEFVETTPPKRPARRSPRSVRLPANHAILVATRKMRRAIIERIDLALESQMLTLTAALASGRFAWMRFIPARPLMLSRWARVP